MAFLNGREFPKHGSDKNEKKTCFCRSTWKLEDLQWFVCQILAAAGPRQDHSVWNENCTLKNKNTIVNIQKRKNNPFCIGETRIPSVYLLQHVLLCGICGNQVSFGRMPWASHAANDRGLPICRSSDREESNWSDEIWKKKKREYDFVFRQTGWFWMILAYWAPAHLDRIPGSPVMWCDVAKHEDSKC